MAKEIQKQEQGGALAVAGVSQDEIRDLMSSAVGSQGIGQFDLPRVRIPGSGGIAWEMPSVGKPVVAQEFDAVILGFVDQRAWWEQKYGQGDSASAPPDCYSLDLVHGQGMMAEKVPGHLCAQCPMSQFGSAVRDNGEPGRGQACKQVRFVYALRPDDLVPMLVALPPTSLKPVRAYLLALLNAEKRSAWGVVTRFGLEKTSNADGVAYSRVSLSMVRTLEPDEAAAVRVVRDNFLPKQEVLTIERRDVEGE